MGFSSFLAMRVSVRLSFDGTSVWPPQPAPLPRGAAGCGGQLGGLPSRRWHLRRREKAGGLSGNSPGTYRLDAPSFRAGRKAGTAGHFCLLVLSVVVGRLIGMSRYRLQLSPAQEQALLEHCGHARYVWNLAVEQQAHWKPGRKNAPGFAEQCRQLTEARAENEWLRRSEERRVGKECRSRWTPDEYGEQTRQ